MPDDLKCCEEKKIIGSRWDCQGRGQEIAVTDGMAKKGLSEKTEKIAITASFVIKINIGRNLSIHL